MSTAALTLAAFAASAAPAEGPVQVQRPATLTGEPVPDTSPEATAPEAPAQPTERAPEDPADEAATAEPPGREPETAQAPTEDLAAEPESESAPQPAEDRSAEAPEPEPDPASATPGSGEVYRVSEGSGSDGPPYYDEAEAAKLRKRYGQEASPPPPREPARWRCLIADPTCAFNFEINAMGAYAYRGRQGDTRREGGEDPRWHSGRAQYDLWLNFPVMVETRGKARYTRMTLGPKGGVAFSDTGTLWGNIGMAARYWLGRGRWAPTIEFTSALSYKLGSRPTRDLGGADPKFMMTRGPVGFTADVGFGLGGFGAIVVGGQYDSPLAREDVPEQFRVSAGGMFFVGFRGNILWGGPAAAAMLTHGLTQRYAQEP